MQDHDPRKLRTFAQNHGLTPIDNTQSEFHHLLERCEGTRPKESYYIEEWLTAISQLTAE